MPRRADGTSHALAENEKPQPSLTSGAQRLVDAAVQHQQTGKHEQLAVHHWLLALAERHGVMAQGMARNLDPANLAPYLREKLKTGDLGAALPRETLLSSAEQHAQARGKSQVAERDLAAAILAAAGYEVIETSAPAYSSGTRTSSATTTSQGAASKSGASGQTAAAAVADPEKPEAAASGNAASNWQPVCKRPTPTLEQFGRDLTRDAAAGKLPPLVGREEELQLVVETLCRRTKRNPVLVGPAGVGKTAIVEGLATKIVGGEVPALLRGNRVLAVQPSSLVAGASVYGEVEKRIKAVLAEASQEGVLLFIDEVHSIIGSGGREGTGDFAQLLKPALARGDLACLAATTDDEYRRFIEADSALERRFQPIRVQELTASQTLGVLYALSDELERLQGVKAPDRVLTRLIHFAEEFMRNRYFPDKAVDLLEQCVAHAVAGGKTEVTLEDAEAVAQRMVGMPLSQGDRLSQLRERLLERALLSDKEIAALLDRLEVTVRGLDLRPHRPNAVALLIGEAAKASEAIAEEIAEVLFGAEERVVSIDFSRFGEAHDLTMLIGAPPGYVGYSESLPIHKVAQMPWCVLQCDAIDQAHPHIRGVLAQALSDGFLTDARGKQIYLSDAVILLTASVDMKSGRHLGFGAAEEESTEGDAVQAAEEALGEELVGQCDLVCAGVASSTDARRRWVQNRLLADLTERYRKQGVELQWDPSVVEWMQAQQGVRKGKVDWERLVDERLSPAILQALRMASSDRPRPVRVAWDGTAVRVEPADPEAR